MNFYQESSLSETTNKHNSSHIASSQSMMSPPLCSTPTLSTTAPTNVPPLRSKNALSLTAQEFVPTTPPSYRYYNNTAANGRDSDFGSAMSRQRFAYNGANGVGSTLPLSASTHSNYYNSLSHNPLLLRQQQILQEKQQLLQKQQELAAATIVKQQLVLSAAAAANHPQDEISNSLKMYAVLSAYKGNETQPSPDDVMQEFATNGYTTDEWNKYQQFQAASNMQMLANSNGYPNTQYFNNYDFNMNTANTNINWLYHQQLENINACNEIFNQNFLKMLPTQFFRQAEAATATTTASINMDYNNQNVRPQKRSYFKKENQVAIRRCVFCENNNEPEAVVKSHSVRDSQGRVLCPKLRIYVCPICGASGDDAHTVKYCPLKPIVTMEDALKAESNRFAKTNYLQKLPQMQV